MDNPSNDNLDINKGGLVCFHLLESDNHGLVRHFTGVGTAYNVCCLGCAENLDTLAANLRPVSEERFRDIEWYCEKVIGQPEVFERVSDLRFIHRIVVLQQPLPDRILSVKPERGVEQSCWIAVLASGQIVRINLSDGTVKSLMKIPESTLQLSDKVALHLSPDNHFAAVVNDLEPLGVVIDLSTGKATMSLNRGDYHPEQTHFPVAFFKSEGRTLLVHGTHWNRLDISNAETGQLLTERSPTSYRRGEERPAHYLDYFHALPVISPSAEWLAEDGWAWHPVGVVRVWSLRRWVQDNVWESEDGDSVRDLAWRDYYWNAPLCWIDDKTIAVWGFGDDDLAMTPAVQLFDAESGDRIRWFAGPKEGALYFDRYLFSTSPEGTDVWDIDTSERLLHDPDLTPVAYHPDTHQFLSLLPDDAFRLSQLEG
jgi:hypothetical protein